LSRFFQGGDDRSFELVRCQPGGLNIIDISNPALPTVVGALDNGVDADATMQISGSLGSQTVGLGDQQTAASYASDVNAASSATGVTATAATSLQFEYGSGVADGETISPSTRSIYRWLADYENKGFNGLQPKPRKKVEASLVLSPDFLEFCKLFFKFNIIDKIGRSFHTASINTSDQNIETSQSILLKPRLNVRICTRR